MGQVRHGSTTMTHATRTAIQRSEASTAALSRELGMNPKTVAKWRKRATAEDMKIGPKASRSTVLTEIEEAVIVAFRRHTLLPLEFKREENDPGGSFVAQNASMPCNRRYRT